MPGVSVEQNVKGISFAVAKCDRYSGAAITMFRIFLLLTIDLTTAAAAISPSHVHMEALFASSDLVAAASLPHLQPHARL
jgi:hypothetical protein